MWGRRPHRSTARIVFMITYIHDNMWGASRNGPYMTRSACHLPRTQPEIDGRQRHSRSNRRESHAVRSRLARGGAACLDATSYCYAPLMTPSLPGDHWLSRGACSREGES